MIEPLKNTQRLFVSLLVTFMMCLTNFLGSHAENISGNNTIKLRGEIFYGHASWYGTKFHGRKTSNGEKYNKCELTAAHKSLPFNTIVQVTNLKNNKSVIVRINDRGPFKGNRILDLSEEAASIIDSKKEGIAHIKLQVLSPISQNQS